MGVGTAPARRGAGRALRAYSNSKLQTFHNRQERRRVDLVVTEAVDCRRGVNESATPHTGINIQQTHPSEHITAGVGRSFEKVVVFLYAEAEETRAGC